MTTHNPSEKKKSGEVSFEAAFTRLEEILDRMNAGETALDESIKLFEEADQLITSCNKRLVDAERRVEMLIKNRNGELILGANERPMTEDFSPSTPGV